MDKWIWYGYMTLSIEYFIIGNTFLNYEYVVSEHDHN